MSQIVFSVGGCYTSWGATRTKKKKQAVISKLKYGVCGKQIYCQGFATFIFHYVATSLAFNEHFLCQ